MAAELTRAARLAVLGLTTTTDTPPLIVQAAVLPMTGGLITGRLHMYLVAPDPAMEEVPVRWWANLRVTLPWAEVAGRLAELLDQRTVVVHEPGRLDVLRRHLPDWQPHSVLVTRELAQQLWPRLTGHDLDTLTAHITNQRVNRVDPGAVAEAQAVALLLGALLPAAHPTPQPAHPRAARHSR